jgi:ABC-type sugar transport system ATPase subunit
MIELKGIRKMYGNVAAVDQVSLVIPDNARVAITGPSGSGKTTLLRIIAGLDLPDEGTLLINGKVANDPGIVIPPQNAGLDSFSRPPLSGHI